MANTEQLMYIEVAREPLEIYTEPLPENVLKNCINPLTKAPYEGIILKGPFAFMDMLNNNFRYYTKDNYIKYVEILRQICYSARGLYGELEHPKTFSIDSNKLSHKILDIWFDAEKNQVWGYVLLLNNDRGKEAQEVIKSGGLLGISARGGGKEIKNTDGTINATLELLTTFDLVYHPGFSYALPEFNQITTDSTYVDRKGRLPKALNESISNGLFFNKTQLNEIANLMESEKFPNAIKAYQTITMLFESESQQETKTEDDSEIEKLEKGDVKAQKEAENQLQQQVELTESQKQEQSYKNKLKKLNDGQKNYLVNVNKWNFG